MIYGLVNEEEISVAIVDGSQVEAYRGVEALAAFRRIEQKYISLGFPKPWEMEVTFRRLSAASRFATDAENSIAMRGAAMVWKIRNDKANLDDVLP